MEIIDEGKANRHVAVTSKFLLATRDLQLDSPNDSNALPVRLVLRIMTIISLSCTMSQLINRAAMGRARFLLYTGFFFFFCIFFVGDQTQTSTWPNRVWDFEITQPVMFIRQKLLKH